MDTVLKTSKPDLASEREDNRRQTVFDSLKTYTPGKLVARQR
jgi:hypothetical protein